MLYNFLREIISIKKLKGNKVNILHNVIFNFKYGGNRSTKFIMVLLMNEVIQNKYVMKLGIVMSY